MFHPSTGSDIEAIRSAVTSASHWLPQQGSLKSFVHHNTLHALEYLPFFDALRQAETIYGAQGLLSESSYRLELNRERITWEQVDAVLRQDLGQACDSVLVGTDTRFDVRATMLRHQIYTAEANELNWLIHESSAERRFRADVDPRHRMGLITGTRRCFLSRKHGLTLADSRTSEWLDALLSEHSLSVRHTWDDAAWERFTLRLLWLSCQAGVRRQASDRAWDDDTQSSDSQPTNTGSAPRLRDALWTLVGEDLDVGVNEVLIRFTSSFVDQGFAHWSLPNREEGFFAAFLALYASTLTPPHEQLVGLGHKLSQLQRSGQSPEQVVCEAMAWLKIPRAEWEHYFRQTLLALPGWAGMLWQLETRPDRANAGVPAGSLLEFLAVRLLLEQVAAEQLLERQGLTGSAAALHAVRCHRPIPNASSDLELAYALYQVAQLRGWRPEVLLTLSDSDWGTVCRELTGFDAFQRCRIFQLALESTYRHRLLNGLLDLQSVDRSSWVEPASSRRPSFQWIACIDDREESLRRHLEEVEPDCQTFGYAGFFAVPMYFRGIDESHFTPLCPVVLKPENHVEEVAVDQQRSKWASTRRWRRWYAVQALSVHNLSRGLLGGVGLAMMGVFSTVPMVMRVLFPRLTSRWRRHAISLWAYPAETELTLDRGPSVAEAELALGFTLDQQVAAVARLLTDIGLTRDFARLVIVCGHGSASLNNPHESAYNCGACGGGRGGPNARAFCQLANRPAVRERLAEQGLVIPADTHFLGMFHNTCDDDVQYFDLEQVPTTHLSALRGFQETMETARARNAQERCRRFQSAGVGIDPTAALKHVQERAEDLSQTRPEYNHATNAACIVGRRSRTRGLFLDRRAFLASYDPTQDSDGEILRRILAAVVPVCAGINLEYYFSRVDTQRFGCGSKLPHNVTSLLGVMDGAASDLRTGLSEQMVEIHQPLRLLLVVEATRERLQDIIRTNPQLHQICYNHWIQVAAWSPDSGEIDVLVGHEFESFLGSAGETPHVGSSWEWFRGCADHLEPVLIGSDR